MASEPSSGERSEQDVRESIRSIVAELAPEAPDELTSEARLVDDLGFHSLALLELAFTLEDEFDLPPIDEATARQITTVGAVQDHVVTSLAGRGELAPTT
jgi:acyl carrier protein